MEAKALFEGGPIKKTAPNAKSERKHPCQKCSYSAGDSSNLAKHVRAVHDNDKKYACPECEYRSADKSCLNQHVRSVHRRERPHKCDQCYHAAKTYQYLTAHVRAIHAKDRRFRCDVVGCGYSTGIGNAWLRSHVKSVHLRQLQLPTTTTTTITNNRRVMGCGRCQYSTAKISSLRGARARSWPLRSWSDTSSGSTGRKLGGQV